MASKIEICNMALGQLGVTKRIATLKPESPDPGEAQCALYYDTNLDSALASVPWPFAMKRATLVKASDTPPDEWAYQYEYPADAVRLVRIADALTVRRAEIRLPFVIEYVGTRKLINTNVDAAVMFYVFRETDSAIYPGPFITFLANRLAAEIAMPLLKDRAKANSQWQMALLQQDQAIANAFNEQQHPPEPDAAYMAARD